MRVTRVAIRDFRNHERAELLPSDGITVLCGPNGAGKTNALEALYFGCTARSCRTTNEREMVRFGAAVARVSVGTTDADGDHLIEVGFEPGSQKRIKVDGAPAERLTDVTARPLVCVFLPDRLELVKGAPGVRRAHLDQLLAALWPARGDVRAAYARALAQRNALVARIRAGRAGAELLDPWDSELARLGAELMRHREEAVGLLAEPFARRAGDLGLEGGAELSYRPRSRASDAAGLEAELRDAREADLARGFTGHGPHRDELLLAAAGRRLRSYGSQGQQRLALLSLLLAERDVIAAATRRPPLMLLDDVMSELDGPRREALVEVIGGDGQALVTATDADHVPGAREGRYAVVNVEGGTLRPLARPVAA